MRRISLILALIVVAAATRPAPSLAVPSGRSDAPSEAERTSATLEPSTRDCDRVRFAVAQWAQERGAARARERHVIPVALHVITSGGQGEVSNGQAARLIDKLNGAFASSRYHFTLASLDRTESSTWFRMGPGTAAERAAKRALAVDPSRRLNLYTCAPGRDRSGWATFPWVSPENDWRQAVVVSHAVLADESRSHAAIAQVMKWLGDSRTLTAAGGPSREAILAVYRPSLFDPDAEFSEAEISGDAQHPGDATRAIEFRGAGPNPFRFETAVRFTISASERVTLKAFNVQGQLVRTLMDAQLPAGAHSALFAARDLAPGMYYLDLRVGGTRMTRSVTLVR